DHRGSVTGPRLAQELAREGLAGQAAKRSATANRQGAARVIERETRGYAAAGRAAIHLPFPEDAKVERGRAIAGAGVVGQDRAVEEGEIAGVRMLENDLRAGCSGDLARSTDERRERCSVHRKADAGRRQDRVEGAAEGDVEIDAADALRRDWQIEVAREGRHALERDRARAGFAHLDGDAHHAARAFQV